MIGKIVGRRKVVVGMISCRYGYTFDIETKYNHHLYRMTLPDSRFYYTLPQHYTVSCYNAHQNMQNIYGRKSSTRDLLFYKKSRLCVHDENEHSFE